MASAGFAWLLIFVITQLAFMAVGIWGVEWRAGSTGSENLSAREILDSQSE